MYEFLLRSYCTITATLADTTRREEGQGTLEYVGIVIVAGILVAAVVGGLSNGDAIKTAIETGIKKVTSAGGGS